jgi:hypothetical protein
VGVHLSGSSGADDPGFGTLVGTLGAVTRTRLGLILGLVVGLPVVAFVALLLMIRFYDGRRDIELATWADPQDAWTRELMPGARWATDETCGDDVPCVEAVTSETLTMYRFEDRDDARALAERLGDEAYLTGWIVVRFEPDGLDQSQRYDFEYSVGCINTWVSEDGRDC